MTQVHIPEGFVMPILNPMLVHLVGSRFITGGERGNDWDVLFLVGDLNEALKESEENGYKSDLRGYVDLSREQFTSVSRGDHNVLFVKDVDYFRKWVLSAEVCRVLHLMGVEMTRQHRVAVHEVIRERKTPEAAAAKARESRL